LQTQIKRERCCEITLYLVIDSTQQSQMDVLGKCIHLQRFLCFLSAGFLQSGG